MYMYKHSMLVSVCGSPSTTLCTNGLVSSHNIQLLNCVMRILYKDTKILNWHCRFKRSTELNGSVCECANDIHG